MSIKNSASHLVSSVLLIAFGLTSVIPLQAFAAARAVPFTVGQTLDPGTDPSGPCGPTDTNCFPTSSGTSTSITVLNVSGTSTLNLVNSTTSNSITSNSNTSNTNILNASNTVVTGTTTSQGLSIGSLSGFLKATAGAVGTALVNVSSDITGVLGITNGGTGTSTLPIKGQILIGNSSGGYDYIATSTLFAQGYASTSIGAKVLGATNAGIFFYNNGQLQQDTSNFSYDPLTSKLHVSGGIDPVFFSAAGTSSPNAYYESYGGQFAAISALNSGRIRYNATLQQWEVSTNGTSYQALATATTTTNTLSVATTTNGYTLTSTVNGFIATTSAATINSNALSTTTNTFATIVNGVSSLFTSIINSLALSIIGNTLTANVNGVIATSSVISSNTLAIGTTTATSTVNGVIATSSMPAFLTSITNLFTTAGNIATSSVNGIVSTSSIVNSAVASSSGNLFNFLVNGFSATTASIINSLGFASSGNIATTTINGLVATSSIINSSSLSYATSTNLLTSTVNGVVSTTTLTTAPTTNVITSATNTITSTVNGVIATTTAINSNALSTTTNTFATIVNGVSSLFTSIINSLALSIIGNTLTANVNGIIATSSVISSNALGTSGTVLTSTVNGVATTTDLTNIVASSTSNILASAANVLTSTVNGKVSSTTAINTHIASSSGNVFQIITNGVISSLANLINSFTFASAGNITTTSINGLVATSSIINSSSLSYATSTNLLTTNINGVIATTTLTAAPTNNTFTTAGNIATSTVNGIVATSSIVNSNLFATAGNIATSSVNGVTSTSSIINTVVASSSSNVFNIIVNGIASAVANIVNSLALSISGNTLTANVNGVIATSSVISSNTFATAGNVATSSVNGVVSTSSIVNSAVASSSGNLFNFLVNGFSATTASIINSLGFASSGNIATTSVNGVTATTSIVNSSTLTYATSTGLLTTTINGVVATTSVTLAVASTTHTFTTAGNFATSTVNGVVATSTIVNSNSFATAGNIATSSVNGVTSTSSIINSSVASSSANLFQVITNGIASAVASIINSLALSIIGNTLTANVNGVIATSSVISSNTLAIGTTTATSTVNGVIATSSMPAFLTAITNLFTTGGNVATSTVNGVTSTSSIITSAVASSSSNLFNFLVNGFSATTASIINSLGFASAGNIATTSVNGVTATTSIINSNTLSYATSTNLLTTTINGVIATTTLTPAATTHTITSATNTITSIVNGVTATTTAVNSVVASSSANLFQVITNGIASAVANIVNSLALSISGNTLTANVNGILATSSVISSNSFATAGNIATSSVNGVVSTSSIINSSTLSYATSTNLLTTTINGVVSTTTLTAAPLLVSSLLGALATNTIDNLNFAQAWNWSTATSSNPFAMAFDALTSGRGFSLASAATALIGDIQNITSSGNATTSTGNLLKLNITGASSGAQALAVLNSGTGLSLNIQGAAAYKKGTDYVIVGQSNNVNFGNTSLVRLVATSSQTITGIIVGADGQMLTIINAGSSTASIANLNASSTATNQIVTGTNSALPMLSGASISLVYDTGSNVWRIVGGSGGSANSYSSVNLTDFATGGSIGTAIATVDIATNFNILQTTTLQTLTIPSPTATSTTIGKIITVNNTGSANFTIGGVTVPAGSYGSAFVWNGSIWNPINAASNVAAENGSITLLNSTSVTTANNISANALDLTGGSFTLPSAGTWEVTASVETSLATVPSQTTDVVHNFAIYTLANVLVPNSETQTGGANNNFTTGTNGTDSRTRGTKVMFITTTGPTTYKLRAWTNGNNVSMGSLSGSNSAGVTWNKISGNSAVTGQTVDFINVKKSTATTLAGATDILFDVVTAGNIPYNTGTGLFTLSAGKTYLLTASLRQSALTSTSDYEWQTAGNIGLTLNTTGTASNQTSIGDNILSTIYTPTVTAQVKVRNISGTGTASGNYQWASIVQLGSTASTGVSFNSLTNAIAAGSLDNTNYSQVWNWSTATSTTALALQANALTTGTLLSLTSTGTSLAVTGTSTFNGIVSISGTSTLATTTISNLTVSVFNAVSGVFTNLFASNATVGTSTVGILTATSSATLATTTASNLTAGSSTIGVLYTTSSASLASTTITSLFKVNGTSTLATTSATAFSAQTLGVSGTSTLATSTITSLVSSISASFGGLYSRLFSGSFASTTVSVNDIILGNNSRIRINGSTSNIVTVTGISAGIDGQEYTLTNASSTGSVTLVNQASVSALNSATTSRIITGTGSDLTISPDSSISVVYDGTSNRWRVIGGSGGSVNSYTSNNLLDFPTGGVIGAATATVDIYANFNINQTTVGQALSLPTPTASTTVIGKVITVTNTGSAMFTMYTTQLSVSSPSASFVWTGSTWNPVGGTANVAGEFGENNGMTSGQTVGNTTLIDVVGSSFTLPSAGIWEIEANLAVGTANNTNQINFGFYDSANAPVPNSSFGVTPNLTTTPVMQTSQTVRITTTGAATYKLKWASASTFTATLYNIAIPGTGANGVGNSKITWKKIGGNSAVVGQSVDTLSVSKAALWATSPGVQLLPIGNGTQNPTAIITANAVDLSTPDNTINSGAFTLTATGMTATKAGRYQINYSLSADGVATANQFVSFGTKNNVFTTKYGLAYNQVGTSINRGDSMSGSFIVDVVVGDTVQIRITEANNGATTDYLTAYNVTVTQLGTTALTGISLNFLANATAAGSLDSTNFDQIWNWSTETTGKALSLVANTLTTGTLLDLSSTGSSTANIFHAGSATTTGFFVKADSSVLIGTSTLDTNVLNINGGITLASTTPTATSSALYNNAGILFWNGVAVSSASTTGALSSLSGAVAANTINNANFDQIWNWNTETTGNALTMGANTLTTGNALVLQSSNVATVGNLFQVTSSSTAAVTNGLARFNFQGTHTGNGFQIDDVTVTGTAMALNANSVTSGSGLTINANSVGVGGTNGTGLLIQSTSATVGGSGLMAIVANSNTTGSVFRIIDSSLTTGNEINLASGSTGLTGSMQTISLTGNNVGNSGNVLDLSSTGAASIAKALNVTLASTGLFANGGVRFNFQGAHTGNGFQIDDSTVTGNGEVQNYNSMTTGSGFSLLTSNIGLVSANGFFRVAATGATASTTALFARIQPNNSAGSGLTILNNGNVGIGNVAPGAALAIIAASNPEIQISSSTTNILRLGVATIAGNICSGSGVGDTVLCSQRGKLLLGADTTGIGTIRMTINTDNSITMANTASLTVGGVWTNASDRNLKENFLAVDGTDILGKISQLPLTRWNYKSENATTTHIGPIAQDFYAAFGLGNSDKTISTIDPAGIALVGIQAQQTLLGSFVSASTTGLTTLIATIQSESVRDPIAAIVAKATVLTDFVAARVTAVRGYFDEIFAKKATVQQLCIGTTCIDENQLKSILSASSTVSTSTTVGTSTNTSTTTAVIPVITLGGNASSTVSVGTSYTDVGATITTPVNANWNIIVSVDGGATSTYPTMTVDTSTTSTHIITFTTTDPVSGLSSNAMRTVTVQ